jgi:hypothetical protein
LILVDSSVWIDYFKGTDTPQTRMLDSLLGGEPIAIGDLMLTEVLQGFDGDRDFNRAKRLMISLTVVPIGGERIAVEAAHNFRRLRARGITVRKTIDCLIATHCIVNRRPLLHADRDFDAFAKHLQLPTLAC